MTHHPSGTPPHPNIPDWITNPHPPTDNPTPAPGSTQPAPAQPAPAQSEQQWQAARYGSPPPATPGADPAASTPDPGVPAGVGEKSRWRSGDGKPTGVVLAGAGSLLAVLAFLGGTAVGHAWGSSGSGTEQTQFNGPGGGRFRQLPQGTQPGQGTQQAPGTQQGQGTVPGDGTQNSGAVPPGQQVPGQTTQSDGQTRTT